MRPSLRGGGLSWDGRSTFAEQILTWSEFGGGGSVV